MAVLDIFIPGRIKANLSQELAVLHTFALAHSESVGLSKRRTALWKACCDGAADLVTQLFISKRDKQVDWGLNRHRRKLNQSRLSTIYWWMLLYQLVILRNRGLDGYDKNEEFDSLRQVAHDFDLDLIVLIDFRRDEIRVHNAVFFVGIPQLRVVLHHVVAE